MKCRQDEETAICVFAPARILACATQSRRARLALRPGSSPRPPAPTIPNLKAHTHANPHTPSMHAPARFHSSTEGLTIPVYSSDNGLKVVKIAVVPSFHCFQPQVRIYFPLPNLYRFHGCACSCAVWLYSRVVVLAHGHA